MAFSKGHERYGGRQKGKPNKLSSRNPATRSAIEVMESMGHNPIAAMVDIAQGILACNVCRGALKTKYKVHDDGCPRRVSAYAECACEGELKERVCQSCYGTGYEILSPELRGKMNAELAKYRYSTLRQVEHTGTALENRPAVQITFIEAPKPVPSVNIHSLESPAAAPGDKKVFSPVNKTIIPTFTK